MAIHHLMTPMIENLWNPSTASATSPAELPGAVAAALTRAVTIGLKFLRRPAANWGLAPVGPRKSSAGNIDTNTVTWTKKTRIAQGRTIDGK